MSKKAKSPQEAKVIAIANQKGGTAKTTSTVNLGVGLVNQGKKVLLVDADPQGDLTTALGWTEADNLDVTLTTQMERIIRDEPFDCHKGILHHEEGVDLVPTNIELSGMEMMLVNAMGREATLKNYLSGLKREYDYILIDCMPSLGMLTINARATADSLKQNYGRIVKVYQTVIPVSVKTAETSAAGKSIYAYDKNGAAAKAYADFTREVMRDGERQRNKDEATLGRKPFYYLCCVKKDIEQQN